MKPLNKINSTAVPIKIENIDTDQIIPARFLKAISREGFGENLFRDWRFDQENQPIEGFILNDKTYSGKIIVAGQNFGCGSSREHAAWAIKDYGFDIVISSYFADIFKGNALNNGILPIVVDEDILQIIFSEIENNPNLEFSIDVENQVLEFNEYSIYFELDPYKKICLINGYDDMDYLLSQLDKIKAFETQKTKTYENI